MSSSDISLDAMVAGAGVIGLAVGRALARAGLSTAVVDAGAHAGEQGSSHNSGVIHAGLYYPRDSFKARFCLPGNERLYRYCQQRSIAHRRCGKWVVAVDGVESQRLRALRDQARRNGVQDLVHYPGPAVARYEPWLAADSALFSPSSGIIDTGNLLQALLGDLREAGGMLSLKTRVQAVQCAPEDFRVLFSDARGEHEARARMFVNAAGLGAGSLASACDGYPQAALPEIRLARGNYFRLRGTPPSRHLVYPLPQDGGLGVHLTLDMAGQCRFGPDVEWVRTPDMNVNTNRESAFRAAIQRYWPDLPPRALAPDYAGVRPKAWQQGTPVGDFVIQDHHQHGISGLIQLFGIESPGLTACLPMADYVLDALTC